MQPKLALIICTLFVLFLLYIERKQAPDTSHSLWFPTIWMMIMSSRPLGVWFRYGSLNMKEGSPLDRVFLISLLCLGLLILSKRKFAWYSALKENPWLILFLVYILFSVFWSDMPYISFKRSARELIAVVMSFLIVTESEPRQALQSILRRTIYVLIPFSYILINYFPEYGRAYHHWTGEVMWLGVASQKNGLGAVCLSAAFFLIWSLIRRKQGKDIPGTGYQTYLDIFILILTFWLMGGPQHNFSYSVTSNATFILALSALILLYWIKKHGIVIGPKACMAIVAFIIGYGTFTPFLGKLYAVDISSTFGRDTTLTGRSEIWATLIPFAMKKPIFGHGFGGFWTNAMRNLTSSNGHNGYLDVVLDIGFSGLFIFAMFLLSCCRRAQREMAQNFDWGIFFICYILITVVHNIAESSSVGFESEFSAVVLTMAVSFRKTGSHNLKVLLEV